MRKAANAEAFSLLEQAHASASRLASDHPGDLEACLSGGRPRPDGQPLLEKQRLPRRHPLGRRFLETAALLVAHGPGSPGLAAGTFDARYNLAYYLKDKGELEAARSEFTAALAITDRLLASAQGDPGLRLRVAVRTNCSAALQSGRTLPGGGRALPAARHRI